MTSLILFPVLAWGQIQTHPHIQVFLGYEPYKQDASKYSILTGGELDRSAEKSYINVDQAATTNAVTFGARAGVLVFQDENPFRFNFDMSCALNVFTKSFYGARFGLSIEPEFKRPTSPLAAFLGAGIDGYILWGNIGEVGSASPNDLYLDAPDGHLYPIGSDFDIQSNFLMGVNAYFGLRFYTGKYNNIFVLAGYQVAANAEKWNYTITDCDNSDFKYDIPRSLLPMHPNKVVQDGPFFRIGFSFTP
jgi:hypothetical protein